MRSARRLALSLALAVTAAIFLSGTALAASPGLVISQVYGAGGNANALIANDYVELFNRGTTDAALDGYSIQYTSATGTGNFGANSGLLVALSGTVPAGRYYLVGLGSGGANGAPLPAAQAANTGLNMAAGAGKVALVDQTAGLGCNGGSTPCNAAQLSHIIDLVGYGTGASGANFFEGAGQAPTISALLADFRGSQGCTDTDNNGADFSTGAPAPRNIETAAHACEGAVDTAPFVTSTTPANAATGVTANANITVNFSEPVTTAASWFTIACAASGSHDATSGAGLTSFTIDPTTDFTPGESCTVTILAAGVTDNDGIAPANMAADYVFPFTVASAEDAAPSVVSTTPAADATNVDPTTNLTVTFSEPVDVHGNWFIISCTSSGVHDAVVSGGNVTYTLNPTSDFAPGETCSIAILRGAITDVDGNDPPDNMASNFGWQISTAAIVPIHDVQGTTDTSPKLGQTVTVEGVVVGDFQGAGQFSGYYVQEEDSDADTNPATSEGIFVFSSVGVNTGDIVRVTGRVSEFSGLTELTPVSGGVSVRGTNAGASVTPTPVTLPVSAVGDLERYEGMSAVFSQTLTVTEVFTLARFGEVVLSGTGRLYVPTSQTTPGAAANALAAQNARSRILLDDGLNTQNPAFVGYPQGGLSASNTLRVGDTLPTLSGVVDFRFDEYRVQPTAPVNFTHTNPRPAAPDAVGGNLRIASFNVLNFFNGDGAGGGFPTARGANTPFEFQRQRQKEVNALSTMNADIVGLMEMENDAGPNSAVADLVAGLNDKLGAGTYAYIDTGVLGTDEIKVALIYKPGSVTPVGTWKALTAAQDPRFDTTRNRPSLAQTFQDNATGRKLTVDVNHLKSKGSVCDGDPDTGDGSGNCNVTRTQAAAALVDWLKTDPTGSGDPDFLLIGDMNSYTFESPIQTFVDGGLTNLVRKYDGLEGYSYVFDGESGYLDHALATKSLEAQVSGVGHWHINADEPIALDYNVEFKSAAQVDSFYSPEAFRASDHDPVLIGVALAPAPTANAGGPYSVPEGGSTTLAGSGTGQGLTYAWDLDNDGSFETAGQTATFSAATIDGPATRQVRLRVSDGEVSAVSTATVQVTNVAPTATFTAPPTVFAGFSFALALSSPSDPSAADRAAGFTYAFDCGDGTFVATAGSTASCPTNDTGTRTVRGRINDKDGGSTVYQATTTVIVTAESLCDLTIVYQTKDGVANSLCAKLQQGSYDAYANEVAAQAGKSLTSEQAATLIRLVQHL
jgi:uncharacterized protein